MRAASERTQSAPKEPTRAAAGSTQALSHPKKVETPLSRRPNAKNSWRKQFPHGLFDFCTAGTAGNVCKGSNRRVQSAFRERSVLAPLSHSVYDRFFGQVVPAG